MIIVACVTASVQIAACESDGEVVRITGADVVVGELQLVDAAGGGGRAATQRESGFAVPEERCSAEGSLSTAGRHSESTATAGSTAEDLVGSTHVALSSGDVGAARVIHCHGSISGAKYIGIADRNQSAAIEHEGSYTRFFLPTNLLTLNLTASSRENSKRIENSLVKKT